MIWAPSFTTRSGPPIDHHQGRATNTAPAFNHVQNYRDTLLFYCLRQDILMSRIARVVVPGIAHHVTQRGNRCWRVFFSDEDYEFAQGLVAAATSPSLAPKYGPGALHAEPCAGGGGAIRS